MKNNLTGKLALLLLTTTTSPALAFYPINTTQPYRLVQDYTEQNFFNNFQFFSDKDPTNGHVQYLNMTAANASSLAGFLAANTNNTNSTTPSARPIFLGVDSTTPSTPQGRPSTRVSSLQTFNHSLIIADILHMPAPVCGTWPAFWLLGTSAPWPDSGEVDILENVNTATFNKYTLHSNAGIRTANYTNRGQSGNLTSANCDVAATDQEKNIGCSVSDSPDTKSYGDAFNDNGGGVFATLIDMAGIRIWFFPRDNIPADITSGSPNPPSRSMFGNSTWPMPNARFDGPGNEFDKHFRDLQIVFNIGFCGEWAGKVWDESCRESTGVETCEEYVGGARGGVFEDVYWGINSVRVYEVDEGERMAVLPM